MTEGINIILSSVVVIYIFFAYLLFTKGKIKKITYSYLFVIVSAIFWTISMILYRACAPEQSVFFCRILYISAIFPSVSFLLFAYVFPYGKLPNKKITFILIILSLCIGLLVSLSDVIIKNVVTVSSQEKIIIWGWGYFFYFLFISGAITTGLYIIFRKYLKASGTAKIQLKYIFWGYFVGSGIAMVPNLILPWFGYFKINWLGQIFGLLTVAFTLYAIINHRLMDIKFVMRRYSVYLVSLVSVLIIALVTKYIFFLIYPDFVILGDVIILITALIFFNNLKDYFYRLANKYFFSSLYDSRDVIAKLTESLRSTLEVEMIYRHIAETLAGAFHSKAIGILTWEDNSYLVRYNSGFTVGDQLIFKKDEDLYNLFIKNNKPIIVEEILRGQYPSYLKTNPTIVLLKKLGIEILSPLNIKDRTIGLMALGAKESGDMYNDEDLQVLSLASAQTAITLENALLYKETRDFNVKLELEVKKATHDLVSANEKLKKLDRAKSDFISIASHQLRTPLTVIKGYISMMLEGNFGALTELEKNSLDKVYESNERLIKLVENLLNVSRIESGRLQYNIETLNLSTIVESVIDELMGTALKKGLKITYKKSQKFLPNVEVDEEKIRQVLMNLIDNSIKYTKKGGLVIKLEQVGDFIIFKTADTGMGISAEEMPTLFKRFSRGKGTALVHTEGTGLGLYVARKIIEAHKGKIWAESRGKGEGSRFCFSLPIKS